MRDIENSSGQPGITAAISSVQNPALDSLLSSLMSRGAQQNGHHADHKQNGELKESDEEEERKFQTIEELSASLKYLHHQMTRIMEAMKIEPCKCASCERRDGSMCQSAPPRVPETNHSDNPPQPRATNVDTGSLLMQIFQNQQNGNGHALSNGVAPVNKAPLPPSQPRTSAAGRRSKYCTPEEKRLVAEYAHIHGASAAARKFNIPPAIASYYYKREVRNIAPKDAAAAGMIEDIADLPGHSGENQDSGPSTPLKKESFKLDLSNPAHTSGSPGFLRGRGRGRPKLIGDELDAELVEHMVNIKNNELHGHLTASQALDVAREFIMQKQPGLLVQQGGHVSLKITWAMKLVSRIAERQKEMEMGLQAGALNTLQRQASLTEIPLMEQQQMAELLKQMSANALANAGNGFDLEGEDAYPEEDISPPATVDDEIHSNEALPPTLYPS